MSSTFKAVAGIISETCDIPLEDIRPDSHATNDLSIDSLDFLDIVFAIDKEFSIKLPLEEWLVEVDAGKLEEDDVFILEGLCRRIDALVAAKQS